jgi:hypothetical protein
MAELHEHSELFGWTPRAGSRLLLRGRPTTINLNGHRGAEVERERTPGIRRIVMLGDSIAFGTHVADHETFAHLVDVADAGLEVVNLAVQGYGIDQALLKLEHEGLGYSPDLVVLNVCVDNDLVDTALPVFLYDGRYPKPYFRMVGDQLVLYRESLTRSPVEQVAAGLRRHSSLYAWLTSSSPGDDSTAAEPHWTQRKARALEEAESVRRLCLRLVARMRRIAALHGADLAVVVHPNRVSFLEGSSWADAFARAPALPGLRVFDMRREYRERGLRWEELALDGIGHLSAAGHRAAATILREGLSRQDRPSHTD